MYLEKKTEMSKMRSEYAELKSMSTAEMLGVE